GATLPGASSRARYPRFSACRATMLFQPLDRRHPVELSLDLGCRKLCKAAEKTENLVGRTSVLGKISSSLFHPNSKHQTFSESRASSVNGFFDRGRWKLRLRFKLTVLLVRCLLKEPEIL